MNNPIKNFTKKEWILWIASLLIVIVSNLFSTDFDLLTLMAALIGVTSLIFAAKGNGNEVEIQVLHRTQLLCVGGVSVIVTFVFYLILAALDTPNIVFSTISVVTSFLAATLTMLRSSYYALGYAANDIVLIVLWTLASLENPAYIPVVVNFTIFFFNDMYGFISWKHREILLDL